jgi:hypothetical protein
MGQQLGMCLTCSREEAVWQQLEVADQEIISIISIIMYYLRSTPTTQVGLIAWLRAAAVRRLSLCSMEDEEEALILTTTTTNTTITTNSSME